MPLLAMFCCAVYSGYGGCRCLSSSALSIGVVNSDLGMVVRWADVKDVVEVVAMRGL